MYDSHDFVERAGALLFAKAGQRFEAALASRSISDLKAISPQVAREILVSVVAAVAAEFSPTANIGALRESAISDGCSASSAPRGNPPAFRSSKSNRYLPLLIAR